MAGDSFELVALINNLAASITFGTTSQYEIEDLHYRIGLALGANSTTLSTYSPISYFSKFLASRPVYYSDYTSFLSLQLEKFSKLDYSPLLARDYLRELIIFISDSCVDFKPTSRIRPDSLVLLTGSKSFSRLIVKCDFRLPSLPALQQLLLSHKVVSSLKTALEVEHIYKLEWTNFLKP